MTARTAVRKLLRAMMAGSVSADRYSPECEVAEQMVDVTPEIATLDVDALARWIEARVATRDRLVPLPQSGAPLTIRGPDHAAFDRLVAASRATKGRERPYWADVWPSGMALADLALLRADDLAGVPTLELGCGLGVTATAALAAGADLAVVDYAPLSLAFCRLNALRNTARAPRLLTLNWREPLPDVLAAGAPARFPFILGADILYDKRDVAPLLALVERLLAPGGELWLAEPGREPARRFVEALLAAGWHDDLARVEGPWPGGEAARVRLHTLTRSPGAAS